eukprot:6214687-Pleurochrysis_carterae.AAC.1
MSPWLLSLHPSLLLRKSPCVLRRILSLCFARAHLDLRSCLSPIRAPRKSLAPLITRLLVASNGTAQTTAFSCARHCTSSLLRRIYLCASLGQRRAAVCAAVSQHERESSALAKGGQTVCVEEILYRHALIMGREAAVDELLGKLERSCLLYQRAKLLLEQLAHEAEVRRREGAKREGRGARQLATPHVPTRRIPHVPTRLTGFICARKGAPTGDVRSASPLRAFATVNLDLVCSPRLASPPACTFRRWQVGQADRAVLSKYAAGFAWRLYEVATKRAHAAQLGDDG